MPAIAELTGQRFGLLTVCKQMPTPSFDKKRNRYWECVCECGERTVVRTAHLRSGQSRSCGCTRRYDLWGKRFGRLTVVDRSEKQLDGERRWVCDCDCGTHGVLRHGWQLRSGDSVSCGCALKEAQAQFGQRRIEAWKKKKAAQAAAAQKATATP